MIFRKIISNYCRILQPRNGTLSPVFIVKPWTVTSCKLRFNSNFAWIEPTGHDSGINIYNSLLRRETPLILENENLVKWYSCGPTVYDSAHMGHVSCYIRFDIIRRIMQKYFDLNVVMVMGITDIDDKIINKALEENVDIGQITKKYEDEFHLDMSKFNVTPPSIVTRVTEHIPRIIAFIQKILDRNLGYVTPSGTVYFDYKAFGSYGRFIQTEPNDQVEGIDPEKKSPQDFALWKAKKENEPFWESPWGKGRPGWHIECSAMASHVFGATLDIHSGGIDLMFPHHENEECQSVAFHNRNQWANYWIHTGHLHLQNDHKMSKSLKNTISVEEFLSDNTVDDFRMFCIMKPYRNNIELSKEALQTPKMFLKKVKNFLDDCDSYCKGYLSGGTVDEAKLFSLLKKTKMEIKTALKENFSTPKALDSLNELITNVNKILHEKPNTTVVRSAPLISICSSFVKETFFNFGIDFQKSAMQETSNVNNHMVDSLVKFRDNVRENARRSLSYCKSTDPEKKKGSDFIKSQNISLLKHCDDVRDEVVKTGIQIKVFANKQLQVL